MSDSEDFSLSTIQTWGSYYKVGINSTQKIWKYCNLTFYKA